MTKVAIYGFVRIAFDLLGPPAWWWALPPIILGALTAVLGLLYAVLDRDLKRVLAYSTIENVGVIFVALGLALAFRANGEHEAAAVAMAAALLHALNHSWFKSLLFLGAGAVLHATGRRDLDGLGGLIHRMPRTAAFFLVGALAASALPPLNGFVSEWLLFQAVIAAPALPQAALHFASPAIGAMLALAAALAAACFVRVYGTAFLGRPRSAEAGQAHDVPLAQQIAMGGLAFLCILGGLLGSVLAMALAPVLGDLVGGGLPEAGSGPTVFSLVAFDPARSIYDAPVIALFVAIASLTTLVVVHRLSARRTRRGPAWDCGFPDPSPATQYTASSFAQPLRRVYGAAAFAAQETVVMPPPGDSRPARFSVVLVDHVWRALYAAPGRAVLGLSERLNALQFLTIRRYLVLMFAALVILLADRGGDDMTRDLVVQFLAQGAQMTFVLLIAPLAVGVVRRVKARLMRRQGPPLLQGLFRPGQAVAQGIGDRRERLLAVPRGALPDLRADLGGGRPGAELRLGPDVQLGGRRRGAGGAAGRGARAAGAGRHGCRHQLRRHRLVARDDDRHPGRARHDADRADARHRRRHDPPGRRGRFLHCRAVRRARVAGAVPGGAGHRGAGRECPHSGRQPGDASRAHHGP